MIKKITEKVIQVLGKKDYVLDENLSTFDLFIIIKSRLLQFIRGLLLRMQLNKAKGYLFIGKGCNITHKNKISVGKTFSLGDYVEINALSKDSVSRNNCIDNYFNEIYLPWVIGDDDSKKNIENGVWIGTRSVILDGVTVGKNSILAAGSIVTKNI